jgi:hypothetical protein
MDDATPTLSVNKLFFKVEAAGNYQAAESALSKAVAELKVKC